jgi:hypothetical protein
MKVPPAAALDPIHWFAGKPFSRPQARPPPSLATGNWSPDDRLLAYSDAEAGKPSKA